LLEMVNPLPKQRFAPEESSKPVSAAVLT